MIQENKTWFTGCLHLQHQNIVECLSTWSEPKKSTECRKFATTIEEHDRFIIDNINKYVKPNDTLYLLGDLIFDDKNNLVKYMKAIHCYNVHLLYGNHDDFIKKDRLLITDGVPISSKHLFSSCNYATEIFLSNRVIHVGHYPLEDWRHSGMSSYNFHSHMHGAYHENNRLHKRIDVGWDSSYKYFGIYRPFEMYEAIELSKIN